MDGFSVYFFQLKFVRIINSLYSMNKSKIALTLPMSERISHFFRFEPFRWVVERTALKEGFPP